MNATVEDAVVEDADPAGSVEADVDKAPQEPVRASAPVAKILPVILVGDWVRLKASKAVPDHLVNRLAAVSAASIHTAVKPDNLSDSPYQYQLPGDSFNVYVRETGDTLVNLTRASFVSHGPTAVDVDRHAV